MNEFYPLVYTFHFYLFGLVALAAAIVFVTRKSPVAAALWLVVVMTSLAALYVMLDAEFVAVIQVLVYAGAIMVVFLFIVMLLNLGTLSELGEIRGKWGRIAAALVGLALVAELAALSRAAYSLRVTVPARSGPEAIAETGGVIGSIAAPMFRDYLLAFELTSVLLLVAIIGSVVLARKRSEHDAG
ncbi:MAG: NADH-quinone oxidoreductase subunit J [Gemmatimonadaceae bacterium]|nr:NADH-quinone oxidoreductase subunit J [Gemmatimonadaceae bacterium]